MAATDDSTEPAIRFKRRKIAHPRKAYTEESIASSDVVPELLQAPSPSPAPPQSAAHEDEESVTNLKEILRQRKKPQDRLREAARKATEKRAGPLVYTEAPAAHDTYSGRFVAQTGQVVDKDDAQMTAYVEARLAEKNYREYGWPIPKHLESIVATLTPSDRQNSDTPLERQPGAGGLVERPKPERDVRMAAGLGKLQEVDLGPEATAKNLQRIEDARRRLEGLPAPIEEVDDGRRKAKKPRRPPKAQRRNSEDIKRDKLVEEVLREAKLEYFEEDKPPTPPANGQGDTDEAFYEHFRREYESQESSKQRKPPPPPTAKGVKEPSKGPKLGGSRSARAAMAMRIQEEQANKNKRVIKNMGNTKVLGRDEFTAMDTGKPAWYAR